MDGLTELEQAVLNRFLTGNAPGLEILRIQASAARLSRRELTGVGFYCFFDVPPGVPTLDGLDITISDVNGNIDGLHYSMALGLLCSFARVD